MAIYFLKIYHSNKFELIHLQDALHKDYIISQVFTVLQQRKWQAGRPSIWHQLFEDQGKCSIDTLWERTNACKKRKKGTQGRPQPNSKLLAGTKLSPTKSIQTSHKASSAHLVLSGSAHALSAGSPSFNLCSLWLKVGRAGKGLCLRPWRTAAWADSIG